MTQIHLRLVRTSHRRGAVGAVLLPGPVVPINRTFLLSPARCDGRRAKLLFDPRAQFPLAQALREPSGVELGDVFSFLSGLYFRGKLTYARAFANAPRRAPATLVITTDRGLRPPEERVRLDDLRAFSDVDLSAADERYVMPLRRDAEETAKLLAEDELMVLLGSIATGKYIDVLLDVFGD